MNNIKGLIKAYEEWVARNPATVGDVETTAKWCSYFIAGRISDSNVVSELIYTLSNLLVLYNDRIIDRTTRPPRLDDKCDGAAAAAAPADARYSYRLKVMLTTLEYSEVFIEISAKRLFGNKGRWLFIALLQLVKAAGRFFILKHSTEQIITSPPLPSLNRRELIKKRNASGGGGGGNVGVGAAVDENKAGAAEFGSSSSFVFKLKRSGRVVRKVEGSPPLQYRDFKLHEELYAQQRPVVPKELLLAEYLYIAKPLIHLAAIGAFGERRWKQYVVALALDFASIRLYGKNRHLMSKQQKIEMSRRCINLLLYLMRSPFYDRLTQSRLERVLGFVATRVPLLKMVAAPLRDYIPHWQDTYFYLWST